MLTPSKTALVDRRLTTCPPVDYLDIVYKVNF
jgi:hypothetical protein